MVNWGFRMKSLSVVGQGFQTEEKVVGFYDEGWPPTFRHCLVSWVGFLNGALCRRQLHERIACSEPCSDDGAGTLRMSE